MSKRFTCRYRKCPNICDEIFPNDMHIISVFGASNKGKTKMLTMVIKAFEQEGSGFKCVAYKPKRYQKALDKTYIFEERKSGLKVGITTTGDACYYIAEEMAYMKEQNCDLYVCASHKKGSTFEWLLKRTAKGELLRYPKNTLEKTSTEAEQFYCNKKQAEEMVEIIKSWVSKHSLNCGSSNS